MKNILFLFVVGLILLAEGQFKPNVIKKEISTLKTQVKNDEQRNQVSNRTTILQKTEIPVLCYHRIRTILPNDGENMKTYSVSPSQFAEQMETLYDNGFHTISPEQLYEYLVHEGKLPSKPILITFDDTREEQYRLGAAELKKYGFKGLFFIMTVSIDRPGYMTKGQIKNLSDNGYAIGAHSWDHHLVTKYKGTDWEIQLQKPKKKLESITGKPVKYFAYPSGVWSRAAIPKIKSNGYQLAFILSTQRDLNEPIYTIRRLIVPNSLSADGMLKAIQTTFNK
ncbi:polysaccharide deacetylase family protein [Flavobacterium sp.]|jgi:peptidoglycan/xylan/chitin deacetylase (PgdA/CDA1 family)|uniref:polysaccharide deacetylase family protein n=1 Tax=Flavobacterium sp. TaxID=239 RepID=UPI0037C0023C